MCVYLIFHLALEVVKQKGGTLFTFGHAATSSVLSVFSGLGETSLLQVQTLKDNVQKHFCQ